MRSQERGNRAAWEAASGKYVDEHDDKGALIWIADLGHWAGEVARVLRPGGHLFVLESHPLVPLWIRDEDEVRVRPDRSYFAREHVNDTFPGHGAVEQQRTLAETVVAVLGAGLEILHLAEHPEPFWRPAGVRAAAWRGQVPNTFSLLARRPHGQRTAVGRGVGGAARTPA